MRKIALVAMLVLLASCAAKTPGGTPAPVVSQPIKTTIVEVLRDACSAYGAALSIATQALNNNLLSESDITAVSNAKVKGDALCKGPVPTNYVAAITNVLTVTGVLTQTAGGK